MIVSMTGFGKASYSSNGFEAQVEIRSVNHRFLDLSIKVPKAFETRENDLRELVRRYIERGRISINVTLKEDNGFQIGLKVNREAVQAYKALLEDLRKQADIEAPIQIEHLLAFSDVLTQNSDEVLPEAAWECVEHAVEQALQELNKMRRREGQEIENDLRQRIATLTDYIGRIEKIAEDRSVREFEKLKGRIENLIQSGELDPARLELEIALLADRVDVTEECIRFRSHNTLFLESIDQKEPAGRKLNFLLQEMNREANTIGAKANDADIAHLVVKIKEEVEKLREQVQNIE